MTDHTLGVHTHSDYAVKDPRTVARVIRHTAIGLAVTLKFLSLISISIGLARNISEAFIVGCTVLVCSAFTVAISLGAYMLELLMKGQAKHYEEVRKRFASLEAAERAIADAVCSIAEPPDELHSRRLGGRQS